MNLLELYSSILAFAGLKTKDDGFVYYPDDSPVIMEGKPLALPTHTQLLQNNDKRVIFHPLLEEINKGESDVLKFYKRIMNIRLNYIFAIIGINILQLANSPEHHSKLAGEQLDMLLALKDVDAKTLSTFSSLMTKGLKADPDSVFANIYIKRGGTVRDKRFSRAGITTFKALEALESDKQPYDVKLRNSDKAMFQNLYHVMLPDIKLHGYDDGSDSFVAPNLSALLLTAKNVTDRYNELLMSYGEFIDGKEMLVSNTAWDGDFTDLSKYNMEIKRIPTQAGGRGTLDTEQSPPQTPPQSQQPKPVQPLQHTPTPQVVSKPKSNMLTMDEIRQKLNPPQQSWQNNQPWNSNQPPPWNAPKQPPRPFGGSRQNGVGFQQPWQNPPQQSWQNNQPWNANQSPPWNAGPSRI